MTKKESEGNQSTNEEREMKLGQLNNEVKQLQNQLEHFRSSENDIRVRTCWNCTVMNIEQWSTRAA